jgi:hypothetical protein
MKTLYFQSFLAPFLHQFEEYQRALDRKYFNDAETLRLFDRYLHNNDITNWQVMREQFLCPWLGSCLQAIDKLHWNVQDLSHLKSGMAMLPSARKLERVRELRRSSEQMGV